MVPDERSSATPDVKADWSEVAATCTLYSVLLETHDPHFIYVQDRERLTLAFPVEHEDVCWLGKNYRDQPKVWKYGCDRGCIARAARSR